MIKYLRDVWILKECGIILFSKVQSHRIDDQCLGGFTSALYHFTQQGLDENLQRFTTNKFEYRLLEKKGLLFLGTFPPKIKDKTALRELSFVADKFLTEYPKEVIEGWNHNMEVFLEFSKLIKPRNEIIGECISHLWDQLNFQ